MADKFIPLSVPNFSGNEKKYVENAVVSEWVSTGGSMVGGFEQKIADYVGMPEAVACNSGTSGLHLAMLVGGVRPGDEVLCPTLTFIAAVNPVRYAFATPVFFGCDDTWCIDPAAVEEFCATRCETQEDGHLYNKATGARVSAMVVVHVFGNIARMEKLMDIAKRYNLVLVEDATEALGSYMLDGPYAGKMAGTVGDIGVYSFNGNKLITTGSGGMVVSNHADWAKRAKHLSTQAKTHEVQYTHDEVGYNYRLTNLQAALGVAQMERIEEFIAHKHALYNVYRDKLDGKNGYRLLPFRNDIRPNKWFFSLYLEDARHVRDDLLDVLHGRGIQTRTIWSLVHKQGPYTGCEAYGLEMAQDLRDKILNIPCSTNLPLEDAAFVADTLLSL